MSRIRKVSLSSGEVLSEDIIPIDGPRFERWAGPVMDSASGENISIVRSALLPETGMAMLFISIVNLQTMKTIIVSVHVVTVSRSGDLVCIEHISSGPG
jgi:hypothetical protein